MQETSDIPDPIPPEEVDMPQGPHPLALAGLALSLLALVILVVLGFFAGYFDLTLTNLAAWGAVGPLGAILSAVGMRRTPRSLGAVGLTLGACATVFLALLMVDKAQRDQDLALKIAQQQHLAQAAGAPATAPAGTQPAADKALILAVSATGAITADDQAVTMQDLGPYLQQVADANPNRLVIVRFNSQVDTHLLTVIFETCKGRGLKNVDLAYLPRQPSDR